MKRALALIIGIDSYDDLKLGTLRNAVNDADDLAAKLLELGFTVIKSTNCNKQDFNLKIDDFYKKLENYDVGLFYFSGHAFQIRGENFITPTDTRMDSDTYAKNDSISLNFIIELMEEAKALTKIIILDACRNNPLWGNFRGVSSDLAPIHAPQGTLIAFSTSPGERAEDDGMGRNSIYTGSLLKHIDDPDIPIEALFKRVRTSVVTLSREKQTPWEHTSLVGEFYFSAGGIVHASDLPYTQEVVIDEQWQSTGTEIHGLIEDLNSTDFRGQNSASDMVSTVPFDANDVSTLFLLGRKLLSAAHYGSFQSERKINNLERWVTRFDTGGENHVINGYCLKFISIPTGNSETKASRQPF